ncbi:unnamed protein product, partial [Linum tenue]
RFPQPSAGGDNGDDQNPRIGDGDRRADLKLASLASRIGHGSAAPRFRFRWEIEASELGLLHLPQSELGFQPASGKYGFRNE